MFTNISKSQYISLQKIKKVNLNVYLWLFFKLKPTPRYMKSGGFLWKFSKITINMPWHVS